MSTDGNMKSLMKRVQSGLRKCQSGRIPQGCSVHAVSDHISVMQVIEIPKVAHTSISIKQNRTKNTENIYESVIFASIVDSAYFFHFHDLWGP